MSVHLIELGHIAPMAERPAPVARACHGVARRHEDRLLQVEAPPELGAVAVHLVEFGHLAALNAGSSRLRWRRTWRRSR